LQDLLTGSSQLAQLGTRAAERALKSRGDIALHRPTGLFLKYLGYDLARDVTPYVSARRNPFRDPRVRRAVALAVDRRQLVERLPASAVPAAQLVPPSIFGFDPQRSVPPADPGRARALLAEAGFPDGFEATLHARQFGGGESAEPLREMLATVGIRLKVVQLGEAEFRRVVHEPPSLFLTRYACDTGDASDVLNAVIHRLDARRGYGYSNFGRYADPRVDAAIEASAGEERRDARLQELQQVLGQAVDEAVVVPLYVDQNVFGLRHGWTWSPRADGLVLAWEIKPEPGAAR
jgi:peptide/nickel transport system substrate-binding protein